MVTVTHALPKIIFFLNTESQPLKSLRPFTIFPTTFSFLKHLTKSFDIPSPVVFILLEDPITIEVDLTVVSFGSINLLDQVRL